METIFAQVDLRFTQGLTQITHKSRSLVELHSIQLPCDENARSFLRGAGIPEEWIDVYQATTTRHELF